MENERKISYQSFTVNNEIMSEKRKPKNSFDFLPENPSIKIKKKMSSYNPKYNPENKIKKFEINNKLDLLDDNFEFFKKEDLIECTNDKKNEFININYLYKKNNENSQATTLQNNIFASDLSQIKVNPNLFNKNQEFKQKDESAFDFIQF